MHHIAGEQEYLHRDFHGALSAALAYLAANFGEEAVVEYLRDFTRNYYRTARQAVAERGLAALAEHFRAVYDAEQAAVEISLTRDQLLVRTPFCPAVQHMRKAGYPICDAFVETLRTVSQTLVEGTPYQSELVEYDPQTGRSILRFRRRT